MGKDVDFIDYVPPTQAEMLKKRDGIKVFARPSDRIIYLFVNVEADDMPAFTDAEGKALGKNPLRDKKVRKAIAMAINRQIIVDKVMKGLAQAETQTIPKGWYGYNPDIKNPAYDPAQAKKLLAESGLSRRLRHHGLRTQRQICQRQPDLPSRGPDALQSRPEGESGHHAQVGVLHQNRPAQQPVHPRIAGLGQYPCFPPTVLKV